MSTGGTLSLAPASVINFFVENAAPPGHNPAAPR
jgi:hypothetical protein